MCRRPERPKGAERLRVVTCRRLRLIVDFSNNIEPSLNSRTLQDQHALLKLSSRQLKSARNNSGRHTRLVLFPTIEFSNNIYHHLQLNQRPPTSFSGMKIAPIQEFSSYNKSIKPARSKPKTLIRTRWSNPMTSVTKFTRDIGNTIHDALFIVSRKLKSIKHDSTSSLPIT